MEQILVWCEVNKPWIIFLPLDFISGEIRKHSGVSVRWVLYLQLLKRIDFTDLTALPCVRPKGNQNELY